MIFPMFLTIVSIKKPQGHDHVPLNSFQIFLRFQRTKGETQRFPCHFKNPLPQNFPIARSMYVTQPLHQWLSWILKNDSIEDEVGSWKYKISKLSDQNMIDIQQTQTWNKFQWPTQSTDILTLNLTFSLFCDWFNPQGNKMASRQQSLGLI